MKLNHRKIIIFGVLILVVVIGFWFFVLLNNQQQDSIIQGTKNLFPFGQVTSNGENPQINEEQNVIGETENRSQITDTSFDNEGPRLRQISDFPTGGFIPITRTEKNEVLEKNVDQEGNETEILRNIEVENQYVRYSSIENASIYEASVTPSEITSELLIKNLIPNAEYAFFNSNGERVVFQYWNTAKRISESYLARIDKIQFVIDPCPFSFGPINVGDEGDLVTDLHTFLNRNPQTRLARSGINSPGNESSLASESTITAIKNFQSLYQIDIDGRVGQSTQTKMEEVCADQQRDIAEEEFNKREDKYRISGFFLPQNIISVNMNPTGDKLFYLQKDDLGVLGVVRDLLNETKETIFESPFSEWTSQWDSENTIEISTKPSYAAQGYSYELSVDTHRYFKSLPEKKGLLTLVSPDNTKILTMEVTENDTVLSIFDRTSKRTRQLSLQTFPEKCVWSYNSRDVYCGVPNTLAYGNEYPDTWYQGLETYNDSLWKVNTETMAETMISDLNREYSENIDIDSINIDSKGEYLYFIDKNNEFLWSYRLIDF